MQNTRLNLLVDVSLDRFNRWLQNPWRRLSLLIISLLFGNFLATIISTTTGQTADWDVLVAVVLVSFTEISNWLVYGRRRRQIEISDAPQRTALLIEMLNATKVGLVYGLFVEAFKIGS